jgi:predicted Zn finger-like uncharacterized protein
MALATKCHQCGAMFRVVADQLKLRGGLVRCGQCRTVFDAIGSLAYVEDAALTATHPVAESMRDPEGIPAPERAGPKTTTPTPAAMPAGERTRSAPERVRDPSDHKRKALGPATTLRIAPGLAPVATVSQVLPPAPAPAADRRPSKRISTDELAATETGVPTLFAPGPMTDADDDSTRALLEGIEVIEVSPLPEPAMVAAAAPQEEPAFIRTAERTPRRGFSIVFSGGSLLLLLLTAAQLAVILRSDVLTRWPEARPVLSQLCGVFGCTLGWPTQPDQLAVIGSELQSIAGTDVLELTAVIRNRAAFTQALPALEVTLSDTQNRPVARKIFSPADYLAAAGEPRTRIDEGLAAGADMTIRIHFETRGLQAAGFLVYPFYI